VRIRDARLGALVGVAAAVVVAVMANLLAARHYRRWDWTASGLYTLSPATVQLLDALGEPVEITVLMGSGDPLTLSLRHLLDGYVARSTLLRVRFVDPDRNPAEFLAAEQRYGIAARTASEGAGAGAAVVVARGERRHFITSRDLVELDGGELPTVRPRLEEALSRALRKVLSGAPPRVCFTSGHGEPAIELGGPEGLLALAGRLEKLNYEAHALPPLRALEGRDPIEGCRVVVVAAPSTPVPGAEVARLRAWVEGGGNLLVASRLVPDERSDGPVALGLGGLYALAGVRTQDDFIIERDAARRSVQGFGETFLAEPLRHALTAPLTAVGGAGVVVTVVSSLTPLEASGAAPEPLLRTSGDAFAMRDFFAWAREPTRAPEPAEGDRRGPLVVAYATELAKRRPTDPHGPRIVVLGTSSVIYGGNWMRAELRGTALFVESALAWLAADKLAVEIPDKAPRALGLRITEGMLDAVLYKAVLALPAAVALLGVVMHLRRQRSKPRPAGDGAREREAPAPEDRPSSPGAAAREPPERGDGLAARLGRELGAVLVVVAALALVVLVALDRGRVTTRETEERRRYLFDAWRTREITAVDVTAGGRTLALRAKEPEPAERRWTATIDGRDTALDEQGVAELLTALEFATFERRVAGVAPAGMGLEAPRLRVTLEMGSLRYALVVGGAAPSPTGALYAEVTGGARGTVHYAIAGTLLTELERRAREARSRRLVPLLSTELAAVELDDGDRSWRLERLRAGEHASGAFLLGRAGARVRASERALDGWLGALGRLEIAEILEPTPAAAGAGARLRFEPRDRRIGPTVVVLGGACPRGAGTLAVRERPEPPLGGCVPEEVARTLRAAAGELVDRRLVGAAESDIVELGIEEPASGRALELARKAEGWTLRRPAGAEADGEAARALVESLVRAEGEVATAAGGETAAELGEPMLRLRVASLPSRLGDPGGPDRVEHVALGAAQGGFVLARRDEDGALLRLPAVAVAALRPDASLLRSTRIHDVTLEDVAELDIACDGKRQRLRRDLATGLWTLDEPAPARLGLGADTALATELADAVRKLRALRWASEAAEEPHALASPWCTISVALRERAASKEHDAGAAEGLEVALGAPTQGGYFAQRRGSGAVFVAPKVLADRARGWLLDRAAVAPRVAEIERALVRRAGRELRLTAYGEKWVAEGGAPAGLAEPVREALAGLFAEAVTRVGAAAPDEGFEAPELELELGVRGASAPVRIVVGRAEELRGARVHLVRRDGVSVTFAVARARLEPLFDAL
jgi:hypothetical protein